MTDFEKAVTNEAGEFDKQAAMGVYTMMLEQNHLLQKRITELEHGIRKIRSDTRGLVPECADGF